jgi:outer membrane protein assembly factor BamB
MLLAICILIMTFCAAGGMAAEPVHRWMLDAAHHSNRQFRPTLGRLSAFAKSDPAFRPPIGAIQTGGAESWCTAGTQPDQFMVPGDLPAAALSIEAWVYIDRVQDWDGIASAIQDNGDYERGWWLGLRNDSFCFGIASSSTKQLTYMDASEPIEPGNWYHVAASYDGKTMQLVVDGRVLAESTAQKGPILYPPKTLLAIGAFYDDNEVHPLKGAIASLAIFDKAISASEFKGRYHQQRRPFEMDHPAVESITGWPTYMRDNRRSGTTPESLELPLACQWVYHSRLAPRPAWPAPAAQDFWREDFNLRARVIFDRAYHVISDGESVFFGSSADDQVVSLDIRNGKPRWRYITAGPVRLAPLLAKGKLYFGSDDGHLYCLDAESGIKQWRFRAAPGSRMVPGNGRIISAWPLRTGVLVDKETLRIAAGLFPTQGTYQYSLDPATGTSMAKGQLNFSPQGYMKRRGVRLMVAQGRAPPAAMGALALAAKPEPNERPTSSDDVVYAGITAGKTHFLATGKGIIAVDRLGKEIWQADLDGHCYSLAVAGNRLLASTDQGTIYCFSANASAQPSVVREVVFNKPAWQPLSDSAKKELVSTIRARLQQAQGFVPLSGYALVTGNSPLAIASTIRSHFPFRVIVLPEAGSDLQLLRTQARLYGIAGEVVIHDPATGQLPYADNLFNLIYAGSQMSPSRRGEIGRVLRPSGGVAIIPYQEAPDSSVLEDWRSNLQHAQLVLCGPDDKWLSVDKPPDDGIGQWDHMYGSAANTSCSDDQLVKGPLALQWFGGPGPREMVDRHHRTVPPLVAHGRLFIPGNDRVICVDAYNGAVNWNTAVPGSRRVGAQRDAGSMTATDDFLYIVADNQCHALSVATGIATLKIAAPAPGDQTAHWGYVAHAGPHLLGSTTRVDASRSGLSRQQISETYYDFIPIVTSNSLFSMDRHDGSRRWQYLPTSGAIVNPTITLADGKLFFVESSNPETLADADGRSTLSELLKGGVTLVALDLESGSVAWRQKIDLSTIQHHLYLSYARGMLLAVGSRNQPVAGTSTVWYDVHAFDARNGGKRWSASQNQKTEAGGSHGEQDHHPAIVGDTIYVEPVAYSITTGKRIPNWNMIRGGHGCGTLSASAHTVFFRAGTATMCDLVSGTKAKVTAVSRPGCWINMIPANGMLLIPEASSGCICDLAIQTSMAFAPASRTINKDK